MSKAYKAEEIAEMPQEELDELLAGSCAHIPGLPGDDLELEEGEFFTCTSDEPWDPEEHEGVQFVFHEDTELIEDVVSNYEHWVCVHCGVNSMDSISEEDQ